MQDLFDTEPSFVTETFPHHDGYPPYGLFDNPVAEVEHAHQTRVRDRWEKRQSNPLWVIWRRLVWVSVIVAVLTFVGEVFGAVSDRRTVWIVGALDGIPAILLLLVTPVVHFRVQYRTMVLASNTIARELRDDTWESLLMTGLEIRQIVLGKWWGTLRTVWRDYVLLALLRIGVVIGLGAGLSQVTLWVNGQAGVRPDVVDLLIVALMMTAFTGINAAFTTAAGLAVSPFAQRPGVGVLLAWVTRVVSLLVITTALTFVTEYALVVWGRVQFGELLQWLSLTMFDNGTVVTAELASYIDNDKGLVLTLLLWGLALYSILAAALLWIARAVIVRYRALPPEYEGFV